jgi:adenylate cyclase
MENSSKVVMFMEPHDRLPCVNPQTAPSAGPRRHRFRVEVGTLVVGMVLAQAVVLLALGYWGSKRLLYSVGHAAHEEEHARVETDVRAFMAAATGAVRALAGAPRHSGEPQGEDRSAELIWALMTESHVLDHLYFVDHSGELIGVQRHPVPALRRVHAQGKGFVEILESKPGLEQLALPPAKRYATTATLRRPVADELHGRPWFDQALKTGRPVWTEPHALAFSGEMGVTFVAPDGIVDAKGEIDGVAAGDIALRHLSAVVGTFSHAGAGESAILDAKGRVLARSDKPDAPPLAVLAAGDVLAAILPALAQRPTEAPPLDHAGEVYLIRGTPVPGTEWRLVSWLPEEAVVGGLRRGLFIAGGVLALCVAAALMASIWLSRRVTGPVELLAQTALRIGRLELDGLPRVESPVDEIDRLGRALDESARSLRAFRKFAPADVVNELVKQGRPLEPGGQLIELTVMFTDIDGFTGITAAVPPGVLVPQLTEYFDLASAVIVAHGGTIDKYIGDGMMVLWGAPVPLDDAPLRACRAALALRAQLDVANGRWEARGLRRLETRIGIHTGPAVVGVLGSAERLAFTAFGDTVNVASRVEALNKELGTRILATGHTVAALGGQVAARALGERELRGHGGRWTVYEITAAS